MDVILLPSNRPPGGFTGAAGRSRNSGENRRRRPLAGGLGRIDNDTCWRTVAWCHDPARWSVSESCDRRAARSLAGRANMERFGADTRLLVKLLAATTTDANNTTRRTLPVWSYAAISGHWLLRERCLCCDEVIRAEHQSRVGCQVDEVDADACVPQFAAHLAFAFDSNVDSNLATWR